MSKENSETNEDALSEPKTECDSKSEPISTEDDVSTKSADVVPSENEFKPDDQGTTESVVKNEKSDPEEMEVDEPSNSKDDLTTVDEKMEETDAVQPVESSPAEPVTSSDAPSDDKLLEEAVKKVSESPITANLKASPQKSTDSNTLTTENLISVLEGSSDKEPSTMAEDVVPIASSSQSDRVVSQPDSSTLPPPVKSIRKYIYKLRSKTGKVLKYVSNVPIVLKKPIISLTKMTEEMLDEPEEKEADTKESSQRTPAKGDADDVDSDNSTKENHVKENAASGGAAVARIAKKRGRPPLSQKPVCITLDEQYSSDATDSSSKGGSSSSYGVQTRKRQLKFLPDGRLLTPGKKFKAAPSSTSTPIAAEKCGQPTEDSSASDSDILTASDDSSQSDRKTRKAAAPTTSGAAKKQTPLEGSAAEKKGKVRKVFDYESYFREKTAGSQTPTLSNKVSSSTPVVTPKRIVEIQKNSTVPSAAATKNNAVGANAGAGRNLSAAAKTSVDPAQLLSSLIGVPILASQLNVVRFKPKVIHDRKSMAQQKNVTFVEDTIKKGLRPASELPRSTLKPFKVNAKPALQRILPKPIATPNRMPLVRNNRIAESPRTAPVAAGTPLSFTPTSGGGATAGAFKVSSSSLLNKKTSMAGAGSGSVVVPAASHILTPANEIPKFDNYTDTRVVKTRDGPKKVQKQKENQQQQHRRQPQTKAAGDDGAGGGGDARSVYDLVQDVFEQMPSWNLHVIPDTNSLCIAQVSRGRMGIPILKKSVELNDEFAAKVYVHQLHCKRYDGVYDTESKILSLIREIDALAA